MERSSFLPFGEASSPEGGGGDGVRSESGGGSSTVLFADDGVDVAFVGGDNEEKEKEKREAEEAAALSSKDMEVMAALERAMDAVVDGTDADAPDADADADADAPRPGNGSPLPPYALSRLPVRENTVVAVDLEKKVKAKESPTPANTYAAKKTVAQGMMDIALITSNANQLRYLYEFASGHAFFHLNVSLIIISLFLQIAVGVTLIFKGRADLSGERKMAHANRLNNYIVGGVFLVTIINVFLAAFSVSNTDAVGENTRRPGTMPSTPASSG